MKKRMKMTVATEKTFKDGVKSIYLIAKQETYEREHENIIQIPNYRNY